MRMSCTQKKDDKNRVENQLKKKTNENKKKIPETNIDDNKVA